MGNKRLIPHRFPRGSLQNDCGLGVCIALQTIVPGQFVCIASCKKESRAIHFWLESSWAYHKSGNAPGSFYSFFGEGFGFGVFEGAEFPALSPEGLLAAGVLVSFEAASVLEEASLSAFAEVL